MTKEITERFEMLSPEEMLDAIDDYGLDISLRGGERMAIDLKGITFGEMWESIKVCEASTGINLFGG